MHVLLGREQELASVTQLLAGLDESSGSALVVRGAAGIGKTALLEAAADLARGRGARVLSVTGVLAETRMPFASLRELVSPVLRELSGADAEARELILSVSAGVPESSPPTPPRKARPSPTPALSAVAAQT